VLVGMQIIILASSQPVNGLFFSDHWAM